MEVSVCLRWTQAGGPRIRVRLLAQRTAGGWVLPAAVARRDRNDPVANVARTSEVAPFPVETLRQTALAVCDALDDPLALELGLDFAIDDDGRPWLIEVNGRPRGRLERLAELWPDRFAEAHHAALVRPLVELSKLSRAEVTH